MKRFSIRILFLVVTVFAVSLAFAARFLHWNYADWKQEQVHIIGGAARWDEDSGIPNLDLWCTSIVPDWTICWLPWEQQDVFGRVTTLDNLPGTAFAEDFERCLAFQYVDTVFLGGVDDIEPLAAVLKKFPRLKKVCYGREFDDMGGTSIPETLRRELPGVEVTDEFPPSGSPW